MTSKHDIKNINHWKPIDGGAAIITMPNIPKQLFGLAPRTVLKPGEWDKMRKRCYSDANYTCEVCGEEPEPGQLDAHELYEYDYAKGKAKFIRTVALCKADHRFIHSGRMLTLFKNNSIYFPKTLVLRTIEHGFKLVYDYNKTHSKKKQLRVYATFLDYLKEPRIADEVARLIDKYEIKFYQENNKNVAEWSDWRLIIGDKEVPSPFEDEDDWKKKMAKLDTSKDYERNSVRRFVEDPPENLNELLNSF